MSSIILIKTGQLPNPVLENSTVKVFFLFSQSLEGVIILLKNAAKCLPMSGSKVVSVSPTEQGSK